MVMFHNQIQAKYLANSLFICSQTLHTDLLGNPGLFSSRHCLPSLFQVSPKLEGYRTTLFCQLKPWIQMLLGIRLLEISPPDQP